jgi:hypothetical protein
VLSHPEWWLDYVDELIDALTVAAALPDVGEPVRDDEIAISHPEWWAEHPDELCAVLQEAVREREPPWIDLDAELRAERPTHGAACRELVPWPPQTQRSRRDSNPPTF